MCVWVEDADKLDGDSNELNIVFYNKIVKNYLLQNNTLGLAGVKGQGKTFLIKVKRRKIEKEGSTICLPKDRMVDTIDSAMLAIDRSLTKYLTDYNVWVMLWKFSICGAILNAKELNPQINLSDLSENTQEIINFAKKRCEPSIILTTLLGYNINGLKKILDDTSKLFIKIKEIHQCVCVFIDKLDQGFANYAQYFYPDSVVPHRSRNASFWQYAQYALAECAYDITTNANNHIKVYYTIRQEALLDSVVLNRNKARNIESYISRLEYTKNDLREMYDLYISNESEDNLVSMASVHTEPSRAFIGIENMPHGYVQTDENVFDYIYRHTFKRPYDLMSICRELSLSVNNNMALDPRDIRHKVNARSNELLSNYIEELSLFLPCPTEEIDRLLVMIPGNTLSPTLVHTLCLLHFNESSNLDLWKCNQNCSTCNESRIFTLLYNIGLLGFYKQHAADKDPIICYENIANRILDVNSFVLPISKHYFLHPALSNRARDLRGKCGLPYIVNYDMIIGDGYEVEKEKTRAIRRTVTKISTQITKEKVFVSSTVRDLSDERDIIRKTLKGQGLHPLMNEHPDFNQEEAPDVHSHDLCLNEVKKCKGFILLIGEEYGGEYSGDLYQKEKEELIALTNDTIRNPSISLMEFYVAKKSGARCYVFASANIQKKKLNGQLKDNVKHEIDYINHFKLKKDKKIHGNWINFYTCFDDLRERVTKCKFV